MENAPVVETAAREQREIREENLPGHIDRGQEGDEGVVREGEEIDKDPQLDRALELLKSWRVFKTTVASRQ
jgi:hypothetical protein